MLIPPYLPQKRQIPTPFAGAVAPHHEARPHLRGQTENFGRPKMGYALCRVWDRPLRYAGMPT